MQRKYKIKIPLTYNNFELKNIDPKSTSEFRIEISGDVKEKIQSDEKIAVSLYNIFEKDESTPEPFIMCEIEGIISNTEDAAIKIADKILNKNLLSRVKQVLSDAADIGRAQKLLNMLKWMGITDFERFGQKISIDLDLLKNLILLRNKTFHGVSQNSENEIEYLKAVETLLYIGEKIINFLRKNPNRT